MTKSAIANICALVLLVSGAWAAESDFKPLWNGTDLNDFEQFGLVEDTCTVEGGLLKCTGKPLGYLATKKSYKNYVLRFDFRFARPEDLQDDTSFGGNSGFLLHITGGPGYGPGKAFPKCVEVNGMNRELGRTFGTAMDVQLKAKFDAEARKQAIKPVGEWNAIEIVSNDGAVKVLLNGTQVCESQPGKLREGPIGFQSEGSEIYFRNLRIKED
ncbi:MAG: 3-keto-disaccharide hydrolase [Planctomycetaceae bacterium]